MFTGIVTDLGRVVAVERRGDTRFIIQSRYPEEAVAIGASIAHSGVCLTVVGSSGGRHAVDVSGETLSCTTLGEWDVGSAVNLEQSLRIGDELGGHWVSGHVDGVAAVIDRRPEGDSLRFVFEAPEELACLIASKGSIALDGVSLTVNEVDGRRFGVNIIPHTQACTTFQFLKPGHRVNLEVDLLARYVARLMATRDPAMPAARG